MDNKNFINISGYPAAQRAAYRVLYVVTPIPTKTKYNTAMTATAPYIQDSGMTPVKWDETLLLTLITVSAPWMSEDSFNTRPEANQFSPTQSVHINASLAVNTA